MKTPRFLAAAALLVAVVGRANAAEVAAEPPPLPKAVYTRQATFSIPFRIEGLSVAGPQPAEIRLYFSEDQGAKWNVDSHVKPEQKNFAFRASHDGEYWFSIRTIDDQGHAHPEGPHLPQLRVVVDTIAPRVDLSAARGPAGEIVAHWHVLDTGLKPDSLKLEYQAAAGGDWAPLAVDDAAQHAAKYTLIGEASWQPTAASAAAVIRATAADEAGNTTTTQVQIKADNPRTGTGPPLAAGGRPAARGESDRLAGDRAGRPLEWPAAATDQTLGRALPGGYDAAGARPAESDGSWRAANRAPAAPDRSTGWPRVPAQTVSQTLSPVGSAQSADWSLLPVGQRPRMVNLRTFELDYEVDSVGSSGVAKVELWGTRDGGRHWANFGADNDNRSPLVVTVDGEGLFGFCVVIQSGNGLSGQPPRDGDPPAFWIGVDLTRPAARITALEPGFEGGELMIRWEASDALLEGRPVSLLYSDQPRGPWTTIAAGLENSGSFAWRLDNRVPERIFIRLEARDEAGNVGLYETPDPVSLDRQRPQGHIRGVRPIGQPAQ